MESNLKIRQVVEGELMYEGDSVEIEDVSIQFVGMEIGGVNRSENKFQLEIGDSFENGSYDVVWHVKINGKEHVVRDSFTVTNDKIDPSLPFDLQYLA